MITNEINVKEKFEPSVKDIAKRKAILTLKGCIIKYSVSHGMKWESKRHPQMSLDFERGYKASLPLFPEFITGIIAVYNRIRHNRPHTSSFETDDVFICSMSKIWADSKYWTVENICKALEIDIEIVKEALNANTSIHSS